MYMCITLIEHCSCYGTGQGCYGTGCVLWYCNIHIHTMCASEQSPIRQMYWLAIMHKTNVLVSHHA